jgi:hypothetical protein
MKHWWQFEKDEERLAYIRSVRRLTEFSDKDTDFKAVAKHSNNGASAYLKGEMDKLVSEGIGKGGLVRSWIENDKCKSFPDVEKVILKIWTRNKKEVEENWNHPDPTSFNTQLFTFFRIYFPYVRLTRLLKESRRQTGNDNLLQLVNDQLRKRFAMDLRKLDEKNVETWGQAEFSAVCYHIFCAEQKSKFGQYSTERNMSGPTKYMKQEVKFEAFKRELASHYGLKTPSYSKGKSQKELSKLPKEKRMLLKELFS